MFKHSALYHLCWHSSWSPGPGWTNVIRYFPGNVCWAHCHNLVSLVIILPPNQISRAADVGRELRRDQWYRSQKKKSLPPSFFFLSSPHLRLHRRAKWTQGSLICRFNLLLEWIGNSSAVHLQLRDNQTSFFGGIGVVCADGRLLCNINRAAEVY